ncbi:MAG: KH domain-containing protein [Proteobacteria bacterium]|nr:KH domain-containing protein [Pseudomonadota bacterium]NIS69375.1 KH domain-containing protein [Pseudomonadota bacterium]
MKELVEKIVQALVDYPEEVRVREIEGPRTNIVEIRVSKPDIGKLIGRAGKNISALRIIVAGAGKGRRYMVEVVEEDRPLSQERQSQEDRNQETD